MREMIVLLTGCVLASCAVAQRNAPTVDQQFAEIVEELDAWKKNMALDKTPRKAMETLLRQGADFQRAYKAEKDGITRAGLLDDYISQRNELLKRENVIFNWWNGPYGLWEASVVFETDGMELDANRPFLLRIRNTRMLFSYKESQRFANMLSSFIDKLKRKETATVSFRHGTLSITDFQNVLNIVMQPKTLGEVAPSPPYRISEFDAKLLIFRIHSVLKTFRQDKGYAEPADLDPATVSFADASEDGGAASGDSDKGTLTLDVSRVKVSQGQKYRNTQVLQQFDYRASLRWSGKQPLDIQVVMFLLSSPGNKLSIVGKKDAEVKVQPGRSQELLLSAQQVIPGPTANGVIVQCFSGGRLLKSYASSVQYKKYADMPDVESQIPPLYQTPPSDLPAATR